MLEANFCSWSRRFGPHWRLLVAFDYYNVTSRASDSKFGNFHRADHFSKATLPPRIYLVYLPSTYGDLTVTSNRYNEEA